MSIGAQAVTTGIGVLAALVAAFLILDGWRLPKLVVALVMTASAGIVTGTVGAWVHEGSTFVEDKVNQMGHTVLGPGFVASVVIGIIVVGLLILRLRRGQYDVRTLGLAASTPLAVTMIPGLVGTILIAVFGYLTGLLGGALDYLFHLAG